MKGYAIMNYVKKYGGAKERINYLDKYGTTEGDTLNRKREDANAFFENVSEKTQDINTLLTSHVDKNTLSALTQKKSEVGDMLSQAESARQYYESIGNNKMLESVNTATDYLKKIDTAIDNRRGLNEAENMFSDIIPKQNGFENMTPIEKAINPLKANDRQKEVSQRAYDFNMLLKHQGKTFDELSTAQNENSKAMNDDNREFLNKENQWLESYKESIATDEDYKKIVDQANSNLNSLKEEAEKDIYIPTERDSEAIKNVHKKREDERNRQISYYQGIVDKYSDYAKYGKSNIDRWNKEFQGMNYEGLKKYASENSGDVFTDKVKNMEGGQDYLKWVEETGQTATTDEFQKYLGRNNIENLSDEDERELHSLEKESNNNALKSEYLDFYINNYKKNTTDYNDLKEIEREYVSGEVSNAPGTLNVMEDWSENYKERYLASKQEYNFNQLSKEEQDEILYQTRASLNIDETFRSGDKSYYDSTDTSEYDGNFFRNKKEDLVNRGYSKAEADSILAYAERVVNGEIADQGKEKYREYGKEHSVRGTIDSIDQNMESGFGALSNIWTRLKQSFGSETPIDWNSPSNRTSQYVTAEREGVKENIESEVGEFIYDSLVSSVDSAATLPINQLVPGATMVILGSSAAQQRMLEAHDKGMSDSEAIGNGLAAGVIEGLFETVSLDKIVDAGKGAKTIKEFFKSTAKSMGIEGSEELFTEIASITYDTLANGEYSDYQTSIDNYMQQGYTEIQAKEKAKNDLSLRVAESAVGGMLGGAFFGGTFGAANYAANSSYREMAKVGKNISDSNTLSELQTFIEKNYTKDSDLYKQMQETDLNDSAYVGYLATSALASEDQRAQQSWNDAVIPAVEQRLEELDVKAEDREIVANEIVYKKNSKNSSIVSKTGKRYENIINQVAEELSPKKDGSMQQWVKDIDLSWYDKHNQNVVKLKNLTRGESFVEKKDNSENEKIKAEISEKTKSGQVTSGRAHLIEDMDVKFDITTLAVREADGKTVAAVKTDDGKTELYDMEDVSADKDIVELYLRGQKYEPEQRKAFFQAYDDGGRLASVENFAYAYDEVYNYGAEAVGMESVLQDENIQFSLTPQQIETAYNAGKLEYDKNVVKKQQSMLIKGRGLNQGTVNFDSIDEKKLNKTQKAAVDVARVITKGTGVNITFFESVADEQGKYQGENGSYDWNTNSVRIDINAGMKSKNEGNNIMVVTLAHELTHYIERFSPEQYGQIQEFIFDKLSQKENENINTLINREIKRLKNEDKQRGAEEKTEEKYREIAKSEIVARGCELMLTDKNAVRQLAETNRGIFGKLKSKIDKLVQSIEDACNELLDREGNYKDGTVSREAQLLKDYAKKIRTMWNEALKEAGENEQVRNHSNTRKDIRNQLRKNYKDDIDNWYNSKTREERLKDGGRFLIGTTSEALKSINVKDFNIYFGKSKMQKILDKHPDMTLDLIKQVPEILEKPIIIMDSVTRNDSLVILGELFTKDGKPVIASLLVDPQNNAGEIQDFGIITSAYEKKITSLQNLINNSKIRYIEPDKKRTNNWLSALRLQLPSAITKFGSINIISNEYQNINTNLKQSRNVVDSNGNTLTEQQQEYFKDSKVRDENGALKVVYHGTSREFNIFDLDKARGTADIEAFFFSGDIEESSGYGEYVRPYYLNITNPADSDTAYDIFFKYNGQEGAGIKAREELQALGYDGVIAEDEDTPEYTEYLAFSPEQIKLIDNENPTEDVDIRYQSRNYSYSELIKKPDITVPVNNNTHLLKYTTTSIIVQDALNNLKNYQGVEYRKNNPVITNDDTGDKIQVTPKALKHGAYNRNTEATIFISLNLGDAIKYGIKVNEAEGRRNNADSAYILMGRMDDKSGDKYYYRIAVNRYDENNMGEYYIDDLYAVRAQKNRTSPASWAGAVRSKNSDTFTSSKISVANFLSEIKDYYGNELSRDVNKHFGRVKGKSDIEGLLYQSRNTSTKTYDEALIDNKGYNKALEYQRELLNMAGMQQLSNRGIERLTYKLIKETKTILSKDELKGSVKEVFDKAADEKWKRAQIVEELKKVTYRALNEKRQNTKRTDYAQTILDELRKTRIRLTEDQATGIYAATGMKYGDWRKSMMGKIIITNNGTGTALDSKWEELSRLYPETFGEDVLPEDMPAELENIIFNLQNDYENDWGFDFEDAAEYCATEVLAEYARLPEVKNGINTEAYQELQEEYDSQLGKVRVEYNKRIREFRKGQLKGLQEARKQWKEDQRAREKALEERYKTLMNNRVESIRTRENSVWMTRDKEKLRNNIIKTVKRINTLVVRPTNQKHAPQGFLKKTAEFCQLFMNDTSVFSQSALDNLKVAYAALKPDTKDENGNTISYTLQDSYDINIQDMIETLRNTIAGKRLSQLSLWDLKTVNDIVTHFDTIIKNEREIEVNGRQQDIEAVSHEVINELSEKGQYGEYFDKAAGFKESLYNNLTPIYFFKRLGKTAEKLFKDVLEGQNKAGKNIHKARIFIMEIKNKHHYDSWDFKKTVELGDGIKLTVEQALYIYATKNRENKNVRQKAQHLSKGGIILKEKIAYEDKKKLKLNRKITQQSSYHVRAADLVKISNFLTTEQKAYADEMVRYLSEDMAALGNETSMQLYGYEKYDESYYFPYKTADSYVEHSATAHQDVESSIMAKSFTKSLTNEASTPVVVGDFTETAAEHINGMITYNALAVAQNNLNKVFNYVEIFRDEETGEKMETGASVKQMIAGTHGEKAQKYFKNFILALNGGLKTDPADSAFSKFLSMFKKSKTYASASVIVQQPSSVCRAMALVNPKYFNRIKLTKKHWEECKKYNGVAVIKEMGGFDTGMGRGTVEYLTNKTPDTILGKVQKKADENVLIGRMPGKMDEITWCTIWNAVKNETKAKGEFKGNEEEFFKAASERFNEVITKTQVYDSVISKSANMSSKSGYMKMITAFMSEPTVSYNMIVDAVSGDNGKKNTARIITSVVMQTVVNGALKALVLAARNDRDEDEDKSYWEKYAKAFSENVFGTYFVTGEWNPITFIPFVKDVMSIFEGYDVSRTDMTVFTELKDALETTASLADEDSDTTWLEAVSELASSISAFTGVPVGNIIKDINAAGNLFSDFVNGNVLPSGKGKMFNAFLEGIGFDFSDQERVKDYVKSGDEEILNELIEASKNDVKEKYPGYSDEKILKEAKSNVRTKITKELKSGYFSGDINKDDTIKKMQSTGLYVDDKGKDDSKDTLTDWEVSELKDQYMEVAYGKENAEARKEIRNKLYKTKRWKSLSDLDKQIKKWME